MTRCGCGQTLPGTSAVEICPSCRRQHVSCSECGAQIGAAPDTVVVQCLYCNTTLQHVDLSRGSPYYTVNVSEREVHDRLLTFLLNRFGIPADFQARFQLISQQLAYVPVSLFRVTAWLNQSIYETDFRAVITTRRVRYRDLLERYRFAVRAKIYADPRTIKGAVYETDISPQEAHEEAWRFGNELLARDQARFDGVLAANAIRCDPMGSVYYPLYEIEYAYGEQRYQAVFDACNGVVCQAAHPMCTKARAAVKASVMLYGVLALVAAAGFALTGLLRLGGSIAISGFGAAVIVVGTAIAVCRRILKAAAADMESREEVTATEHPLVLKDLTAVLPVHERKLLQAPGHAGSHASPGQ